MIKALLSKYCCALCNFKNSLNKPFKELFLSEIII